MKLGCSIAIIFGSPLLAQIVDFARDVAPIFQRCQACHGAQQHMNGLRLDRGEEAQRGGYSGPLIQPGNSTESRLIQYVTGQRGTLNPKGLRMPLVGNPLTPEQVAKLRAWIDSGAKWPAVAGTSASPASRTARPLPWSFVPVTRSNPPAVRNRAWIRNPIDAFVLARLESEGVAPSPEADRRTLIRRVSLDLIGLPPTLKEIEDFLADRSPDAYERLVDRLLASPHYGEKWGRQWLDQARYADSEGHELDRVRPYGWRYRNWVIDSLNRDQPFDQFTVEQIAGDLLPNRTTEQWVATGFHRNSLMDREAGSDPVRVAYERLVDRTNAVATAWLGLTLGCAQCHDHKYDPLTQKEYYQFQAFFNSFQEIDIDAPLAGELGPYLRTQAEYLKKRDAIQKEYKIAELQPAWETQMFEAADNPGKWTDWDHHWLRLRVWVDNGEEILRTLPEKRDRKQQEVITEFFVSQYSEVVGQKRYKELKFDEARKKLEQLKESYSMLTQAPAMIERAVTPKSYLHLGGEYDALGIEVGPGVPAALNPLPADARTNRLTLARWLTSPDNPLTRRVVVNRMWQELFGRGLSRTSEDLGSQGDRPSHPAVLDWLASEFLERGWSRKQILRVIVSSATYRQSSNTRPELETRDPENMLLGRQSRLRLPAELVRDAALAASGLLDTTIGGPSVRPHQPASVTSITYSGLIPWKESSGKQLYRRGLYIHLQRSNPYPQLINFDAPSSNISICRRDRSNTPLQALNLLNDPVFVEAAQALAVRTLREASGNSFADRLGYAFQLSIARPPNEREQERLLGSFLRQKELFARDPKGASSVFPFDLENIDRIEGAGWVGLASVLLNVDEFITRE